MKTNILSILGQLIVWLSFMSALLLRVDLSAESFTTDHLGGFILCSNIPLVLFLGYDTIVTMREEVNTATIEMLISEMGGSGATYTCKSSTIVTPNLEITKKDRNPGFLKSATKINDGDTVTALEEGFTNVGTARFRTEQGWVTYCAGGLLGNRNFVVAKSKKAQAAGKVKLKISHEKHRKDESFAMRVTVLMGKSLNVGKKTGVYVAVNVNHEHEERTELCPSGANPVWKKGKGEVLKFVDLEKIMHVRVTVLDEHFTTGDDPIGQCDLPLREIFHDNEAETWSDWVTVKDSAGELAGLFHDDSDGEEGESMVDAIEKHAELTEAQEAKRGKFVKSRKLVNPFSWGSKKGDKEDEDEKGDISFDNPVTDNPVFATTRTISSLGSPGGTFDTEEGGKGGKGGKKGKKGKFTPSSGKKAAKTKGIDAFELS